MQATTATPREGGPGRPGVENPAAKDVFAASSSSVVLMRPPGGRGEATLPVRRVRMPARILAVTRRRCTAW